MMASLEAWMRSVVLCALFLSLVQLLIPEGAVARIAAFAGGLLLMLSLVDPILHAVQLELPAFQELEWEVAIRQQELEQETQSALTQRIAADTEAYIWDMAQDLGLEVTAAVRTETQDNGVILPVALELSGSYSKTLSQRLEEELGIPPERQVWHEGEN